MKSEPQYVQKNNRLALTRNGLDFFFFSCVLQKMKKKWQPYFFNPLYFKGTIYWLLKLIIKSDYKECKESHKLLFFYVYILETTLGYFN